MSACALSHSAKPRSDTRPSRWSAVSRLVLTVAQWFRIHGVDPEQNVSPSVTSKVSHNGSGRQYEIADMPIGGSTVAANDHDAYRPGIGAPIKWNKPDRNSVTKTKTTAEPTTDCARDEGEVLRTLTSNVGMKKVLKIMKRLDLPFSRKHNAMYDLVDFCLLLQVCPVGKYSPRMKIWTLQVALRSILV